MTPCIRRGNRLRVDRYLWTVGVTVALAVAVALADQPAETPSADGTPATQVTRPDEPAPGHRRMVAALAAIASDAKIMNPFLGENGIQELRQFAQIVDPKSTNAEQRNLLLHLGLNELRLGHVEASIKAFTSLVEAARAAGDAAKHDAALFQLGVAYMRQGENNNCVARHSADSCIFPIRGQGIHQNQEGSKHAIRSFMQVLERTPDLAARWLLNLAHMTIGTYPDGVPAHLRIPPASFASAVEFPRFPDVAPRLGVNVPDLAGGAIADDFDGDGWIDIIVSTMDTSGGLHYFKNDGDGTFTDRTAEAGLAGLLGGLNLIQADYDGDGHLDFLVLRGAWMREHGRHPNSLVRNDGDGTFTDVTFDAGLAEVNYPTQTAAWADYDGDGDLDLYIGNEAQDRRNRFPGQLFRNNGNGKFTDVAAAAGVENLRYAKAVVWGDYDADGKPDLYVSNLGGENRLYRNEGDGTFEDVAPALGVTKPIDGFPSWFWDFDGDGVLDLFVASYYQATGRERLQAAVASLLGVAHTAEPARLYRGNGSGGFDEVASAQKLTRITYPMGANFGDLDNDGWLDFYLGTGYPEYEGLLPNMMYRNQGGTGFTDITTAGGFGHLQKGHGVAFADFDHDGDQDVFEQMGGAIPGDAYGNVLYENPGFKNHWIGVRLVGVESNRSAIGARIRVVITENDKPRSIYRWVGSGGSFGANPLRQQIGLGQAKKVDLLEVFWPTTGKTQTFRNLDIDRFVEIVEDQKRLRVLNLSPKRKS